MKLCGNVEMMELIFASEKVGIFLITFKEKCILNAALSSFFHALIEIYVNFPKLNGILYLGMDFVWLENLAVLKR